MAEKKSLAVSVGLALAVVGLALILYYFPLSFPLLLLPLIPVTAYLGLRVKLIGFPVAAVSVLTAACLVNRLFVYMLLPLYFFGTVGVMAGIGKSYRQSLAWGGAGMLLGVVLLPLVVFWCTGLNVPDAAAVAVEQTESPALLIAARRAEYRWRVSQLDKNSEHYEAEVKAIRDEVARADSKELMKSLAQDVRQLLYDGTVALLAAAAPLYAAVSVLFCSLLIKLFQQHFAGLGIWWVKNDKYRVDRFSDWEMPRGYFLGTFPLVVVLYLLGFQFDYARILFSGVYPLLILVPFGVSGLAVAAYLVCRNGKHYLLATAVCLVLVVFFPLLPVIGLVDYLIRTRKLVKLLDETDHI